jgi:hypothetical protein
MKKGKLPRQKKSPPVPIELEQLLQESETQIQSWLKDPNPLLQKLIFLPSSAQEDFFRFILKKKTEGFVSLLTETAGKDEGLDIALANSLGDWVAPESGVLLQRLAVQSTSKSLRKAVRRSAFRLQSKGIKVQEIEDLSIPVYRPPQPLHPSEGFLSSIDSAGARMVWLIVPKTSHGIRAVSALVSDTEGLVDLHVAETTHKGFQEYLSEFQTKMPWEFVEADVDYCVGLILESVETTKKSGKPVHPEFFQWEHILGTALGLPLKPLIYKFLREEEVKVRPDLLDRSPSLFQLPIFQMWILAKEESDKYLKLLADASSSRLILAPHQQESRFFEIYRLAVHERFLHDRRLRYRRRLEEMAYILWKKGKEDAAKTSLAAAIAMAEESQLLSPHPFLFELVKRSLQIQLEEEKEKQGKESDLIIRP